MAEPADAISVDMLRAVDAALRRHVRPAVADEGARSQLDFAIRAVDFLSRRQAGIAPALQRLTDVETAQLTAFQALQGAEGAPAPVSGETGNSIEYLEKRRSLLEAGLASAMPGLITRALAGETRGAARALIREIVAEQSRFTSVQDPRAELGSRTFLGADPIEDASSLASGLDETIDQTLAAYIAGRFPDGPTRVHGVQPISGGYSKQTIFFTIDRVDQPPMEAVIRMDLPGPVERSVIDEYPLLELLFAKGLPVAEPYWLETDPSHLGGAFMVTARCSGQANASALLTAPESADGMARALAALMAQLHGIDARSLGPSADGRSAADCMRDEINRYYDLYRIGAKAPQPLLDLSYQWLLANIPIELETAAPSIVHGDIGFHNLMIKDAKPTALLDWETAHLGDHSEDLYYTKAFIDPLVDWDRFLEYYEAAGGRPCPPSSKHFYDVWRGARIAANCARIRTAFEDEAPEAIGYAVLAHIFGRRLELEAANRVAEALA